MSRYLCNESTLSSQVWPSFENPFMHDLEEASASSTWLARPSSGNHLSMWIDWNLRRTIASYIVCCARTEHRIVSVFDAFACLWKPGRADLQNAAGWMSFGLSLTPIVSHSSIWPLCRLRLGYWPQGLQRSSSPAKLSSGELDPMPQEGLQRHSSPKRVSDRRACYGMW